MSAAPNENENSPGRMIINMANAYMPNNSTDTTRATGTTDSSTWVDSYARLDRLFSGSLLQIPYRLVDICLLSLGHYYGTGTGSLAVISICLLIFNGIDLTIVLFFLVRNLASINVTFSDEENVRQFKLRAGLRTGFVFFKLIPTCIGTVHVFTSTVPTNTDWEFLRFCLGIVCFSTWTVVLLGPTVPALPVRRSLVMECIILLTANVLNILYMNNVISAIRKIQNPACLYTNIEDLYLRAPLKSFAYVGLILFGCIIGINVFNFAFHQLFSRLASWRTAIVRCFALHFALQYIAKIAIIYYFSVGALLLFQPRSGGSCRSVAPDLYKTLLIWEWIRVFARLAYIPIVLFFCCITCCCAAALAACLPASITVPLFETLRVCSILGFCI
jgi:hypothetical protein